MRFLYNAQNYCSHLFRRLENGSSSVLQWAKGQIYFMSKYEHQRTNTKEEYFDWKEADEENEINILDVY
jgi:hypothetical protein